MNVGELRKILAAFDDDLEVCVSPRIRVTVVGQDRDLDSPHPKKHFEIKAHHVVGQVGVENGEVTRRYIVLAFDDPDVSLSRPTENSIRRSSRNGHSAAVPASMEWTIERAGRPGLLRVVMAGEFSVEGCAKMFEELASAGVASSDSRILFDERELDLSNVNYAEIMTASSLFIGNDKNLAAKRAALLVDSNVKYRVGKQFETITNPHTHVAFSTFLDESEALNWLLE